MRSLWNVVMHIKKCGTNLLHVTQVQCHLHLFQNFPVQTFLVKEFLQVDFLMSHKYVQTNVSLRDIEANFSEIIHVRNEKLGFFVDQVQCTSSSRSCKKIMAHSFVTPAVCVSLSARQLLHELRLGTFGCGRCLWCIVPYFYCPEWLPSRIVAA